MKNISFTGNLRKMRAQLAEPVVYALVLGDHAVPLNAYLGQRLQLRFTGNIHCIQCSRKIQRSFQQGYCFPCMQRLSECDYCIVHPEKCHIGQGPCPQNDWAHAQCAEPHIVYLANSSGLKVGITRCSQVSTRWIDQGACQALPVWQVANRYQSGLLEVCLKQFVADKTDWRKLLKQAAPPLDLYRMRDELLAKVTLPLSEAVFLESAQVTELKYPVQCYPDKITALSWDHTPEVSGILQGIKGQYLLFDSGVINIRKFAGYEVELTGSLCF